MYIRLDLYRIPAVEVLPFFPSLAPSVYNFLYSCEVPTIRLSVLAFSRYLIGAAIVGSYVSLHWYLLLLCRNNKMEFTPLSDLKHHDVNAPLCGSVLWGSGIFEALRTTVQSNMSTWCSPTRRCVFYVSHRYNLFCYKATIRYMSEKCMYKTNTSEHTILSIVADNSRWLKQTSQLFLVVYIQRLSTAISLRC
jgi:hypothetical protein